ncbi:MAG: YapH protein [Parcubacteria group bacterium Gr01-1014_30]|nr:MAG: YapH protein [Parcubacteria group bacterium Gr01-1014_30]
MRKNSIFYLNSALFIIVALTAINAFSLPGHGVIKWAMAQVNVITGEGTINYLARFAGAQNPSYQIGDSVIYEDSLGNVGIGTTGPNSKLDVTSGVDEILRLTRTGATYPTRFRMGTDGAMVISNNNADIVTVRSGNVGIGTTGPVGPLTLAAATAGARVTLTSTGSTNDNTPRLEFYGGTPSNTNNKVGPAIQGVSEGTWGRHALVFYQHDANDYTTESEVLRITSNGNVGIGVTGPTAKLHIGGTAGTDGIRFPDGTLQTTAAGAGAGLWAPSGTNIHNTNSGNVGIGTVSPGTALHLSRPSSGLASGMDVAWFVNASGGSTRMVFGEGLSANQFGTLIWDAANNLTSLGTEQNNQLVNLTLAGNVGIGTTGPNTRLQIGAGAASGLAEGLTIYSGFPTIYFRDSDEQSAMIHVNSNRMYFLSGSGSNDPGGGNNWALPPGAPDWPLWLEMTTGNAHFGRGVVLTPLPVDPPNLTDGMMWMRQ